MNACTECSAWKRRLSRLESAVRQLPLPRTKARVEFLCQFLNAGESPVRESLAGTPGERIGALADLAESLHGEADAEGLRRIAQLYDQLVRHGIVAAAREVPAEERRKVIDPIVELLAKTYSDMDCMAQTLPTEASAPLQVIAKAAQESDYELRALLQEAQSPDNLQ
jgi:hypothetical protein